MSRLTQSDIRPQARRQRYISEVFVLEGKLDDPHFAQKAMAVQRSAAIHERWDFFNHEEDDFSRMVSSEKGNFKQLMGRSLIGKKVRRWREKLSDAESNGLGERVRPRAPSGAPRARHVENSTGLRPHFFKPARGGACWCTRGRARSPGPWRYRAFGEAGMGGSSCY